MQIGSDYYITTNYGVIVENEWFDDLDYICEPTEWHEKQNFAQEVINVICHYRGNIVGGKRIMKLMGSPACAAASSMTPRASATPMTVVWLCW